nr:MAG TPA: hypothetical protein [Caudoviricetes sp.]
MLHLDKKCKTKIINNLVNAKNIGFDLMFINRDSNETIYPYVSCLGNKKDIIFVDRDKNIVDDECVECCINLTNTCHYKIKFNESQYWMGKYVFSSDGRNGFEDVVRILIVNSSDDLDDDLDKGEFNYLVGFTKYTGFDKMDYDSIAGIILLSDEELETYYTLSKKVFEL